VGGGGSLAGLSGLAGPGFGSWAGLSGGAVMIGGSLRVPRVEETACAVAFLEWEWVFLSRAGGRVVGSS
jgi:hypothetical protein